MERYVGWREDEGLKEDLGKYVRVFYQRTEILSFVSRQVQQAVRKELEGPGKLLGYQATKQCRRSFDRFTCN